MTFAPSVNSQIVMVPIIDDNRYELNEDFTGVLTLPSGSSGVRLGAATATVTITDTDSENTALISSKQLGGMLAVDKTCSVSLICRGVIACKHYIWLLSCLNSLIHFRNRSNNECDAVVTVILT